MFFDNYVRLCSQKNKTPTGVAALFGISAGTVSHWKVDGRIPHMPTLVKLADYFGVTVAYLLGEEEEKREDLRVALFNGQPTEEEWQEVLNFVAYVKSKRKEK